MKEITIKIHIHTIITSILTILLLSLHYFVYLGNSSYDLGILESHANTPIDLPGIVLESEKRPTYFSPFQKITYFYHEEISPENKIIEENQTFFNTDMKILKGENIINKYFNESGYIFLTGFAPNQYPSIIYFIIFYFLLGGLIFNLNKIKTLRN